LKKGLSAIAAPVFMRGSEVIAAVGMPDPSDRFEGEELTKKIALVKDFAERISRPLGRRASETPVATRSVSYHPGS
jgi:DNA-binding IclR family transcriptional regulator